MTATAVLPAMLEAGRGSILFATGGAAINPYPLRAGVGISFAGEVACRRPPARQRRKAPADRRCPAVQ